MKLEKWRKQALREADSFGFEGEGKEQFILDRITKLAWEHFDKYVDNFIFRLLGLTGRVEKIFIDIFGPRKP